MALIFKELEHELQNVHDEIKLTSDNDFYNKEEREFLALKREALEELHTYMLDFKWLTHSNSKNKISAFIRSKYNYEQVCLDFNTKLPSLQVSVSRASKILSGRVAKPLDLIKRGLVEEGIMEFRGIRVKEDSIRNENLVEFSPLMVSSHYENLPYPNNTSKFTILDCVKEIKFARMFSLHIFKYLVSTIDKEKFAFLRHVLESNDKRYEYERGLILSFINGETKDLDSILNAIESVTLLSSKVVKGRKQ